MSDTATGVAASEAELQDLVVESDSGARKPAGLASYLLWGGALAWALFQLWIASPLPYTAFVTETLHIPVINSTQARFVHLAFALSLAFLAYPATKKSPRDHIPVMDWVFVAFGVLSTMYLYFFRDVLASRAGLPTELDIALSIIGVLLLLEAARRALGPPLVIIACVFLFYTFAGNMSFMPEVIAHKGQTLSKVASHQWLSTEGVFGIAIGVSTDFVFLFVLFGALLEKAGAGNYFIQVAFSLLGHYRGGPAKAAVLSSAMTGLISGSSIANVVTTGTFTIPLMRRVGFSREKAGAVEVASSVNGQIMPPVMGAAAFLMVEYVGISYVEVVKSAFIPAVISYIALLYLVHIEAVKSKMVALPKNTGRTFTQSMLVFGIVTSSMVIISFFAYYVIAGYHSIDVSGLARSILDSGQAIDIGEATKKATQFVSVNQRDIEVGMGKVSIASYPFYGTTTVAGVQVFYVMGIKQLCGAATPFVIAVLLSAVYIYALWYAAKFPKLEMDDPNAEMVKLPETGPTVKTGLHFILPIIVLVWCLMVERMSPGLSAFWATVFMIFILLTQRPITNLLRDSGKYVGHVLTLFGAVLVQAGIIFHFIHMPFSWLMVVLCLGIEIFVLLALLKDSTDLKSSVKEGGSDLLDGLVTGARNMVGIGIATAAAGIIVGSVSLTGIGQVMTELVELISGGSFVMVLIFTALICLVLGMGLPTTANYIVVASLMANVIVDLGKQNGMDIPLIAVHLFVFYFGIMADVTPPVGLASFAAAAVSGGDPIKTGIQAFVYSIRTIILPFIFIYNTELLLIGVDTFWQGAIVFAKATMAILVFAAATQGYLFTKNKMYETVLLLLVAFAMFRPGYWVDTFTPPYEAADASEIEEVIGDVENNTALKVSVLGKDRLGSPKRFVAFLPVEGEGTGAEKLERFGLILRKDDGKVIVDDVMFDSKAEKAGFDFDYVITAIDVPQDQMNRNWVYLAAVLMLLFVMYTQKSRGATILALEKD